VRAAHLDTVTLPQTRDHRTPSPPWNGGEGWGDEALLAWPTPVFLKQVLPLPNPLPLLRHGRGRKIGDTVKIRPVRRPGSRFAFPAGAAHNAARFGAGMFTVFQHLHSIDEDMDDAG
jgi:hypothetical protein